MQIENTIGNLLLKHNCVVIPSFGGFVAKQLPAEINEKQGVMIPPRKSILFNIQLINNDGLLISNYANENKLTYEAAQAEISKQILEWKHHLKVGERISIDKVGVLYLDAENNIGFQQDRFYNMLLQSYGLTKIHFVSQEDLSIASHQIEKQEAKIFELESVEAIVKHEEEIEETISETPSEIRIEKPKKAIWKYIAAAALIPIGFYSLWIPMKTPALESGILSIKDFNPFVQETESKYSQEKYINKHIPNTSSEKSLKETVANLPETVEVYSYKLDEDTFIPVKLKETVKPEVVVNSNTSHIIVGCFENERNANRIISELKSKGFDAYIVDYKNHMYRVSAGKVTDNFSELQSKLAKVGLEGWLLK